MSLCYLLTHPSHGLYTYTVSKRNYVLTGISSCFVLAHFAVTTYYFAISIHFTSLTQYTTVFGAERVLNSIGLLTDSTIAGILAYLLYSSRTGFAKTNSTIGFLAVYFVSTGFMMDLCSLAALVTSTLLPKTFVFLTILLIYPKRKLHLHILTHQYSLYLLVYSLHKLGTCIVNILPYFAI